MTDNEFNKVRQAAVEALIDWAKVGTGEITMRDSVNEFLDASGANLASIGGEETILSHRSMAVNRLVIDCMYALTKEELSKVDKELKGIAADFQSNKQKLI